MGKGGRKDHPLPPYFILIVATGEYSVEMTCLWRPIRVYYFECVCLSVLWLLFFLSSIGWSVLMIVLFTGNIYLFVVGLFIISVKRQSAYSGAPPSVRQRNAIEMAFRWRTDCGPLSNVYWVVFKTLYKWYIQ